VTSPSPATAIAQRRKRFLDLSRLGAPEYILCVAGPALFAAMFLPWFLATGNGRIGGMAGAATAWRAYPWALKGYLIWLSFGSFILPWIVARGHKLTWREGEMTMVFAITGVVLIACAGVVAGRPGAPDSSIHLQVGYALGLLATVAITVGGYLRQATMTPPGADRISRIWNGR
jgi:hypothetical protein